MSKLFDELKEYSDSDFYGFHMPGHKRNRSLCGNSLPYQLDITEIDGFDDLHHASGILKEAQERAANLYRTEETHFLINGSTVGILSAILGVTKKGDTVLVARNCHKSVYHAIYINELQPVYLYPGFCADAYVNTGISVLDVQEALRKNPEICAVVIVSPTYDGVLSDVEGIADAVHEKGIPLIVDEAHGAHLGFHPYFPENSNTKGADIVIHSLHKTLPSLTQTALLHMNHTYVNRVKIREYLHMLQSSSPSYILMASIDACIGVLEERGKALFDAYVLLLEDARSRLSELSQLCLVESGVYDRSKIIISTARTSLTGRALYQILLADYHLQMEMTAGSYVLAMTSLGDTKEGMERLVHALKEVDGRLNKTEMKKGGTYDMKKGMLRLEKCYNSAQAKLLAERGKRKCVLWKDAVGFVSAEYAYIYPPGIPLIVPGEKISDEAADMLQWYQEKEFSVEGPKEEGYIEVLTDG